MGTKKVALFAFRGEQMCFVHVLLNGMEYRGKGYDVKIVIEGQAPLAIKEVREKENPFHELYEKTKASGLIDCVCMACASKMDCLDAIKAEGLRLNNEMSGHPSMAQYTDQGYVVITF
ncbi:MAG: DsrE family protein [Acidobacteria bacterium]|nr:DsrE family protein [Acidobacteriota bacterium]